MDKKKKKKKKNGPISLACAAGGIILQAHLLYLLRLLSGEKNREESKKHTHPRLWLYNVLNI